MPRAPGLSTEFSTETVDGFRLEIGGRCGQRWRESVMDDGKSAPEGPDERSRGFEERGASPGPARAGHEVIRDYLRRLDERPGVYRMLDARGEVLYVGKARNLRKRVASYAKPVERNSRIGRMIAA